MHSCTNSLTRTALAVCLALFSALAAARDVVETVPAANLAHTEPAVRQALEATRRHFDALIAEGSLSDGELAAAYAEMGRTYHAHIVFGAAEVCYRNAMALASKDPRWPYYLGYLAQQNGRLDDAARALEAVLALDPDHPQARLRLGQVYLDQRRFAAAEPLLWSAAKVDGLRAAALFGLGRLAYAQRDFAAAAAHYRQALAADPEASRVHYALAMAYRGLGEVEQARRHLALRGEAEPGFEDPLVDALADYSAGTRTLYHHALRALRKGQYARAAEALRHGLAVEPDNPDARVTLARALYLDGQGEAAEGELEAVLARTPDHPLARFLFGILAAQRGDAQAAAAHLRRVLEADPAHPGAHFFLGNLLLEGGHDAEAAAHYAAAVRADPGHLPARVLGALARAKAGAPAPAVRAMLEEALAQSPESWSASFLLARLLAAEPKLDGSRQALTLAQRLYDRTPMAEHAELLGMALAASGDYEGAVASLEYAATQALAMGREDLLPRLAACLATYRRDQPCPLPWLDAPAVLGLARVDAWRVFRDYPTGRPY